MTRRDYELIAKTLAQATSEAGELSLPDISLAIELFARNLKADNKRYDKMKLIDDIMAMNTNPIAIATINTIRNKFLTELDT